jgi:hypothetical protein
LPPLLTPSNSSNSLKLQASRQRVIAAAGFGFGKSKAAGGKAKSKDCPCGSGQLYSVSRDACLPCLHTTAVSSVVYMRIISHNVGGVAQALE